MDAKEKRKWFIFGAIAGTFAATVVFVGLGVIL